MRDPNRIEPTLNAIREAWVKVPDWRLGQLIANAVRVHTGGALDCDPFYVEDDDMVQAIGDLFAETAA